MECGTTVVIEESDGKNSWPASSVSVSFFLLHLISLCLTTNTELFIFFWLLLFKCFMFVVDVQRTEGECLYSYICCLIVVSVRFSLCEC